MAEALEILDTNWSGPAASYMITRAVIGADTIEKGCIYVEDGIRKKRTIPRIEVSNLMQRRAATPVSQGLVTVDGQVLDPQDLMLYYEFNPRDYEQHFYAEMLAPKLLDRPLPNPAESFMVIQTMKRLNEFFENAIHRSRIEYAPDGEDVNPATKGDTGADAPQYFYFDGLIKKLLDANTGTNPTVVVPSPITLTNSNIISEMQRAYGYVPKPLLFKYGKGGLKFMLSYPDLQAYHEALANLPYKSIDTTQQGQNRFMGYEVEGLAGLPQNTFYIAIGKPDLDSNMWLGINSVDDNQLMLQKLQNNSEMFFVKGLFKMDTQVGFADQFVIYTNFTD